MGDYVVTTTDDGQKYRLTGDRLYRLIVELVEQVGVEDLGGESTCESDPLNC